MPEIEEKEEKKKETEAEKKKRIGWPKYNIEDLLTENECKDSIAKVKEHEINQESFWELSEGDLESMLEVKVWGRRKQLMKKIQEIKKEHEKEMEEKHKKSPKVDKEGV